ncbi:Integrase family protein [Desulfonema limicola]|uniref:Integrase family protein n=1 Tax=Desulfonema limicola TaxID=45656 RepID=A0A975GHB5_9BACT|nr:tyrosine-type recombinase/integrase [Desulfonema limicola]QTA81240.1 Integrase family protein [Desulfonema limicola]
MIKNEFTPKREIEIIDAVDEYLNEKEAIGILSPSSVHNRRYELKRFAKFCITHSIKLPCDIHKNIVISYLKHVKVSKSSKIGILYTLSGFMDYLIDEELILENIAAIIDKPKIYQPKTDYLTFHELEKIYQSEAQNAPSKVIDRNLLLFSLFTDICLRVSETINLKINDVRLDSKELWVTRKRGKIDKIPLNQDLINKFLNWYAIRPQYKGSELKWVFLSSHGQQLKPRQVHYIVSKALIRAGIIKRKQGPHLLRHSGASLKAQAGENLVMIQYLLGHENLNTTRRYLHFNWDDLKEMVDRSPVLSREQ